MPKIHLHWEVSTVLEGLRAARLPAARTQPAGNPKCNTARPAGARARRRSDRLTTLFAALNESVADPKRSCSEPPHFQQRETCSTIRVRTWPALAPAQIATWSSVAKPLLATRASMRIDFVS